MNTQPTDKQDFEMFSHIVPNDQPNPATGHHVACASNWMQPCDCGDQPKPTGEWTVEGDDLVIGDSLRIRLHAATSKAISYAHNAALSATAAVVQTTVTNIFKEQLAAKRRRCERGLCQGFALASVRLDELKQQLATEREKLIGYKIAVRNEIENECRDTIEQLKQQLAAEREQLATVRELRKHDQQQLAAEREKVEILNTALRDACESEDKLREQLAAEHKGWERADKALTILKNENEKLEKQLTAELEKVAFQDKVIVQHKDALQRFQDQLDAERTKVKGQ